MPGAVCCAGSSAVGGGTACGVSGAGVGGGGVCGGCSSCVGVVLEGTEAVMWCDELPCGASCGDMEAGTGALAKLLKRLCLMVESLVMPPLVLQASKFEQRSLAE